MNYFEEMETLLDSRCLVDSDSFEYVDNGIYECVNSESYAFVDSEHEYDTLSIYLLKILVMQTLKPNLLLSKKNLHFHRLLPITSFNLIIHIKYLFCIK